jgi:hypothetical protein
MVSIKKDSLLKAMEVPSLLLPIPVRKLDRKTAE